MTRTARRLALVAVLLLAGCGSTASAPAAGTYAACRQEAAQTGGYVIQSQTTHLADGSTVIRGCNSSQPGTPVPSWLLAR